MSVATGRVASLYTPEVLAAATALAAWPWDETLPWRGDARSRSCGSTLALGLALDDTGAVARLGLRTHACAIGQAAAHAFARGVIGQDRTGIAAARAAMAAWLSGEQDVPDWPGLDVIAAAQAFPSRHGAIVLAWDAALAALPA
jgi:NifU-like protein involved in Fe-S cluster formation